MRKNALLMALYEVALYLMPFITAPYIARVLGTYGTGVYSYTYSIASYFMVLTQLGVKLYGRREIAACLTREERSKTFWGIWTVETVMFLISTVGYGAFLVVYQTELKTAFVMQYLIIAGAWLDISWLYFGAEDFKIAVTRNVLIKFVSLILIFALIRSKTDYNRYVLIMSLSNLLSVAVMWVTIRKHVSFVRFTMQDVQVHVMPMVKMFIPVLSVQLFSMTDKVFLGMMTSTDAVGIYENAYKISRVPIALITSIGTVMLPRMTKLAAQGRDEEAGRYFEKSLSLTFVMGLACAFGLVSVASTFIPLYLGPDFLEAVPVLQLLALMLVAIAWGNAFRTQFILPRKMDSLYIRSVLYAALINIVLNAILIPRFSVIGAAAASVIAEFTICIYQAVKIRKYFNYQKIVISNLKYVVAALVMTAVILLLTQKLNCGLVVQLLLQIVLGGTVFVSVCCLLEWKTKEWVILDEGVKMLSSVLHKRKR